MKRPLCPKVDQEPESTDEVEVLDVRLPEPQSVYRIINGPQPEIESPKGTYFAYSWGPGWGLGVGFLGPVV